MTDLTSSFSQQASGGQAIRLVLTHTLRISLTTQPVIPHREDANYNPQTNFKLNFSKEKKGFF